MLEVNLTMTGSLPWSTWTTDPEAREAKRRKYKKSNDHITAVSPNEASHTRSPRGTSSRDQEECGRGGRDNGAEAPRHSGEALSGLRKESLAPTRRPDVPRCELTFTWFATEVRRRGPRASSLDPYLPERVDR